MSWIVAAINMAWMLSSRREARRFDHATQRVKQTQEEKLLKLLRQNQATEFGRHYLFSSCDSYNAFARRVPKSNYETVAPWIERIAIGEPNLLTREPILLLEPTSGSTSGRKLIPFTAPLQKDMQRSIAAWIGDLFWHRPAIRRGRAYWSISPAINNDEVSKGGIRIGFSDDTEYLTALERLAIRRTLAVDPEVAKLTSIEEFQTQTLAELVACEDLSLISIWSPTFLIQLVDRLMDDPATVLGRLGKSEIVRRRLLDKILDSSFSKQEQLAKIWPNLQLISCWADGASAMYFQELRSMFPQTEFQPKGVISTEAFTSFPLTGRVGSALAIRSHFFEFECDDDPEQISLAHELEKGRIYRVLITTSGGLYRYQTNDRVEVVGKYHQCPLLRFVGRAGVVSDLVGEKLDVRFVEKIIRENFGLNSTMLLVPEQGNPPSYHLFVEPNGTIPEQASTLTEVFQSHLYQNPHYKYACELGQLGPLQTTFVPPKTIQQIFVAASLENQMALGDVKPTILCHKRPIAASILRLAKFETNKTTDF